MQAGIERKTRWIAGGDERNGEKNGREYFP